jgi:hypothetical protein
VAKKHRDKARGSLSAKLVGVFAWLVLVALIVGGWYWWEIQKEEQADEEARAAKAGVLEELQGEFEVALEKRRLDEAAELVRRMEEAGASESSLTAVSDRVDEALAEEKGQEIAFLVLKARVELEEGRLEEAEEFCSRIEVLQNDHPSLMEIRQAVGEKRKMVRIAEMVGPIEAAIRGRDWQKAEKLLTGFEGAFPTEAQEKGIRQKLVLAREEDRLRREKAARLVAEARALDQGVYSDEAVRLLEEAVALDPSPENQALYEKMSAYGRLIKVPGDHSTIALALKGAKANDRIMVASGTYRESLVIPVGVTLAGERTAKTIIECPAETGAVVTVPKGVSSVRLSSLKLRHTGLVNDEERYAILSVDGGEVEGNDLVVVRASGHGVVVINGGKVTLRRTTVTDSGWDGVAVTGEGSTAHLVKVKCDKNLQHGVDFWDGGSGTIADSVLSENGLNGFLSLEAAGPVELVRTTSRKNRELGVCVSGGVGLTLKSCEIDGNLLGGVFLGGESQRVVLEQNKVTGNGEAGMVFEKGVEILSEKENEVTENEGKQIWSEAVLPEPPGEETGAPPPAPPLEEGAGPR